MKDMASRSWIATALKRLAMTKRVDALAFKHC